MLPEQLQELRTYTQFVVWRYEANGAAKPAKVPYSPRTGQRASPTNPATWVTFDEAISAAPNYSGIGFVLSDSDPYSFIDLDVAPGEAPTDEQKAIFHNFNSYAERSPGGNGLHIIVRGKVPTGAGKRRGKVEIYSRQHYMTVTGNVFRPAPITDCNAQLQTLWAQLGGEQCTAVAHDGAPQVESDEAILSRAATAANGDKFRRLYEGRWQDGN
jgi:primase-polymerase (primpol)-like protein